MSDIFVSYANEDRGVAGKLAGALKAVGWSVWWDRTLLPGSHFDREIEAQIGRARAVVVLWSHSSVESDWVRSEADEGRRRNILVPALLDDAPIPIAFRSIQTASLVGWDGAADDPSLGDLKDGLSALIGLPSEKPALLPDGQESEHVPTGADSVKRADSSDPSALKLAAGVSTRLKWIALAGLALLIMGGLYLWLCAPNRIGGPTGMVFVPAGEFYYGCNERVDTECQDDEKPGGRRSLEAFYMDRTEVTVAAYAECVNAGSCSLPGETAYCNWSEGDREQHPVNCVSWQQAARYCEWRSSRLPTELEWEKAARGADGRKHPHGNVGISCRHAVISEDDNAGCGRNTTWPAGSKVAGASPYGALDMIGNVWEWTADWYDSSQERRVKRGGSLYTQRRWILRSSAPLGDKLSCILISGLVVSGCRAPRILCRCRRDLRGERSTSHLPREAKSESFERQVDRVFAIH